MKYFLRAFTPTKNRRLNELIGFLLFVSATLLFLALASYSPLDPSLNTAGSLSSGSAPQLDWPVWRHAERSAVAVDRHLCVCRSGDDWPAGRALV